MIQSKLFGVAQTAETSDDYYTPKWVFDALGLTFDLDVAAPPGGIDYIPAARYFTQEDDGLTQDWYGIVWCNPPYSAPSQWCDRFAAHCEALILLRADLSTAAISRAFAASAAIWVPCPRLQFVDPDGTTRGAVNFSTVMLGRGEACVSAMERLACRNGTTRRLS